MRVAWKLRALLVAGAGAGALALGTHAAGHTLRVDARHGLSIVVPSGWHLTHRSFTPCTDPVERFSVISGRGLLMLQERRDAATEHSPWRPRHFRIHGPPTGIECCSIGGRIGWVLPFRDHGRAFYAYLHPDRRSARRSARGLLELLDSLRVGAA